MSYTVGIKMNFMYFSFFRRFPNSHSFERHGLCSIVTSRVKTVVVGDNNNCLKS